MAASKQSSAIIKYLIILQNINSIVDKVSDLTPNKQSVIVVLVIFSSCTEAVASMSAKH